MIFVGWQRGRRSSIPADFQISKYRIEAFSHFQHFPVLQTLAWDPGNWSCRPCSKSRAQRTEVTRPFIVCLGAKKYMQSTEVIWGNGRRMWRCDGSSTMKWHIRWTERHPAKAGKHKLFLKWCCTSILELLFGSLGDGNGCSVGKSEHSLRRETLLLLLCLFFSLPSLSHYLPSFRCEWY